MIRKVITRVGEGLVRTGDALIAEEDAFRVEYGNPKEVPKKTILDAVGSRSRKFGHRLLDIANQDHTSKD